MSYWQLDGGMRNSPSFPWNVIGRDLEFTMTYVNDGDESLNHAYLFTVEEDIGRIYARITGDPNYYLVSRICDASCFLGELQVGNTSVDFKIVSLPEDSDVRYFGIPIYIGHDDGAIPPCFMYMKEWGDGWSKLYLSCWAEARLWQQSWIRAICEVDPPVDGLGWRSDETATLWKTTAIPMWRTS